jgi:enamine deaminase RidA (YjgF/YER057c/UK114 family)
MEPDMSLEFILPAGLPQPSGFSYAVAASGQKLLFLAGRTAQDCNGSIVGVDDLPRQFEVVIEAIVDTLKAAAAAPEHVTKMTIFVTDVALYREHLHSIGRIYQKHFGKHYPAMTLVEVRKLFDMEAMIEIEAFAIIP